MVDYIALKSQLRNKQRELGKQQITKIPQMKLRMGIQSLPQRKEIATFNKRLREQQRDYEKQIRAIDKYLLLKSEQDKRISSFSKMDETPMPLTIAPPVTTFFNNPSLKKLRNRFKRKEKFL